MRPLLLITLLISGYSTAMPQTNDAPKKSPAELMREMRLKQLTMPPMEFGQKPTPEFPHVCAVLMDWPIGAATATVVARNTGDASVYTTGTFGVLGGIGHESVSSAAKSCTKVADRHFRGTTPTKEYPYPRAGRVRFYLVGYDGVGVIDGDLEMLRTGKDKCSDLYEAAQRVITELRLITQEQKGEKR
jgi:hypothetical protein